ncbi:MAG TPA: MFS transporter [Rhizomicrobium sp.]|jgi:MFS family permease
MKNSAAQASAIPFYYGWLVLAASAVSEMLVQGATSYAAGLFVLPLQAEFHFSRAIASSPVLILFLGLTLVAPFVGKFLDRYPIRLVVPLCAVIFSGAFLVIAGTQSLWLMVFMLFLPAAIGLMGLGPLNTALLASRWFYQRRGLALGIAAVATSGGGFVVVPLLSRAIQAYGWRLALTYEAIAIAVIIIVLALLIMRDNPASMGLDGHPENQGRKEAAALRAANAKDATQSFRWRDFLTKRAFWIPSMVLALTSGTSQALVVTLVPYAISLQVTPASAAVLISGFSIAAAITKIGAGILADHINQRFLLIAGALFMTLSWATLALFANYEALFASACLGGIALGCALPTTAGLIAASFGADKFGAVMGWAYVFVAGFAIAATLIIGKMYDVFGGYHIAFLAFFVLLASLLVATLLFPLRKPA